MHTSLTLSSIMILTGTMLLLAMLPSVSVLAVTARSAAAGFAHGALVSLGIVSGDIIFILIAIYGLAVLADVLGNYAYLITYIGGAYLITLGVMLWRDHTTTHQNDDSKPTSYASSFLTGLLITLADQKAILFYLGLFPAFLDLAGITWLDTTIIILVTLVAVGLPKLAYAWLAERAGAFLQQVRLSRYLNRLAGSVLIAVGMYILFRA